MAVAVDEKRMNGMRMEGKRVDKMRLLLRRVRGRKME